jgi:hypothetical protein
LAKIITFSKLPLIGILTKIVFQNFTFSISSSHCLKVNSTCHNTELLSLQDKISADIVAPVPSFSSTSTVKLLNFELSVIPVHETGIFGLAT